jgi:hypothetical protein
MTDDRRYAEDDIRKIFERAGSTEDSRQRTGISSEGLTLAELQVIAQEVGLSPARIAEAARTLELPSATKRRNRLGMPVSVLQTVPLSRLPSNYEWELLLAEFRSTFGVRGTDRSHGNIREWTNGTLFVFIEPAESGCRIRLGASRPAAVLVNGTGFAWIIAAAITLLTLAATGDLLGANAFLPPIIGAVGIGTLLYHGKRLEIWARRCAGQMDYIAGRVHGMLSGEPQAPLPAPEDQPSDRSSP